VEYLYVISKPIYCRGGRGAGIKQAFVLVLYYKVLGRLIKENQREIVETNLL